MVLKIEVTENIIHSKYMILREDGNHISFECRLVSNKVKIYMYHIPISTPTSIHDKKFQLL